MEQTYWLGRERASAASALGATSAEARMIHLDLAGRYSIKAAEAGAVAAPLAPVATVIAAVQVAAAAAPVVVQYIRLAPSDAGRPSTVERAFELARSGKLRGVAEICAALKRERHESVDAHLAGPSIRRDLKRLWEAAG